ncbi:MAG TPA: TonB-dependent receptor [Pyrinomonadaceae bacterium]|nr:TonB-dependent receptor [Pyrinomonadaceae bacterium]
MKKILWVMLALCALAFPVIAQTNTGRLVGTVSDPSGVIPGATVVVTDNKTGKERTVVASDDGSFNVPQLDAGTYTVRITAQGHKGFTASEVKIDTGREYSLNAVLEVGDVSATVEVVAGADILNATNAEISNTVGPRQIQELPLNGRNPIGLIQLQAGTASNSANATSINGQRPSATNITRDGVNIQDNFIRANASDFTQQTPTTDDVQEFTVTTQNSGAENGYGASQVNLTTPRGQTEFHGAVYEYNRNSKFAANPFFNNANGTARSFRNFNQYGGKLSGPIWASQGMFFFANYERTIDRRSTPFNRTVLTNNARSGLFTYTPTCLGTAASPCPAGIAPGVARTVNIFTLGGVSAPAGAAATAPTAINPLIASRFLANIPNGNTTAVGDQLTTTGFRFNQTNNQDRKSFTSRADWDINDRNTVNFVFNIARETLDRPDFSDANGFLGPQALEQSPVNFYVGAWRITPTATFTNEVRIGHIHTFPQFPTTQPRQDFLLSSAGTPGLANLVTSPESTYLFQGRDTRTYTFQDNAEYSMGNHSFRFGTVLNFFRVLRLNEGGAIPQYNLGVGTSTPQLTTASFPGGISSTNLGTANQLYALLGGIVVSAAETFNVESATSGFKRGIGFQQDYAYENYNFYFADQWRVGPRLTLNLGLRYEVYPSTKERNGVISEIAFPEGTSLQDSLLNPNGVIQVAGTNVGGGKLFNTDKNNFAPVVSFAWSPQFKNKFLGALLPGDGRTVIRGGFRISYFSDEFLKGPSGEGDQNPGLRVNSTLGALNARPDTLPSIAIPTVVVPRTFAQNAVLNNAGLGVFPPSLIGVDPNLKTASNQEYSFGIQREIGWQTALEVRYVGAYSNNSTRIIDFNQVDIINNGFLADFQRAQNNLALNAQRRAELTAAGASVAAFPISAAFDPRLPGSQQLTVIPSLATLSSSPGGFGLVTPGAGGTFTSVAGNATIIANVQAGTVAGLAQTLVANSLQGPVKFLLNPNVALAGLLTNAARYNHNALQIELRRRFAAGLYFQANYTFGKTLSNSPGTDQRRFEFELDANNPDLEYARATYDQTHIFNFNSIYELPFGRGKRFFSDAGSWLNRLVGGWQINSILRIASGAPFTIVDPRTTFNRATFVTNQPATSNLTTEEIRALIGVYRNSNGSITLIDPSVLDAQRRASGGPGTSFAGQVLFNNAAGSVGNIQRYAFDGPGYFNIDASIFKNIQITERVRLQLRAEAFNVLNHTNFAITNQQRNINTAGAFDLTTTYSPRIIQFAGRVEF